MTTFGDKLYELGGVPVSGGADVFTTGTVYFVDSVTGSDSYTGKGVKNSLATISAAVAKCSANVRDVILVAAGHTETVTSEITITTAGISIIGIGNGKNRPAITANFSSAGDTIAIDGANVQIKNLYFPTPSASQNAAIDINAADAVVENCLLLCGANFLDGVTITANGDDAKVQNNEMKITANGPNAGVRLEGAVDGVQIIDNYFLGGSDTNAWDDAAIDAATTAGVDVIPTNTRIKDNTFLFGVGVDINSAGTTGFIEYNSFGEGTLGAMLDPGALMCVKNFETDAVDKKAREFPTTEVS